MEKNIVYFHRVNGDKETTACADLEGDKSVVIRKTTGMFSVKKTTIYKDYSEIPKDAIVITKAEFLQRLRLANQSIVNSVVMGLE